MSAEAEVNSSTRNLAVWWFIALAALWGPVVYLLGAQWTFFEQYLYGWAVPFMCAFFAWERSRSLPSPVCEANSKRTAAKSFIIVLGLLYWFASVLQEANPLWRAASYGLAVSAVVVTLLLVYLAGGAGWVRQFLFPAVFFLIAVPWPTAVEGAFVQTLTRLDTSVVVEMLGFIGIPAIMHGNVIELSHGAVGVEEACSGIRSLQATMMITLFFGEYFRFARKRRIALVVWGMLLALVFNILRTFFLAWIAARAGNDAVEKWHDPAGVFVFLCFVGVWLLALFMRRGEKRVHDKTKVQSPKSKVIGSFLPLERMAIVMVLCVVVIEISTEAWFRAHELRAQTVQWSAHWPQENPSYQARPVSATVKDIMQFDEGSSANWADAEGRDWLGFYFRWWPAASVYGRMKVALAKGHSPEICLQATGWTLDSELDPAIAEAGDGFTLPFRRYIFEQNGKTLYVFFAVVEDQLNASVPGVFRAGTSDRIRAAVAGSRNFGERSVEVAVTGFTSADDAWQSFQKKLPGWIRQDSSAVADRARN